MAAIENINMEIEGTNITDTDKTTLKSMGDKLLQADQNKDKVLTVEELAKVEDLDSSLMLRLSKITIISTKNYTDIQTLVPGKIFDANQLLSISSSFKNAITVAGSVNIIGLTDTKPSAKGEYTAEYSKIYNDLQENKDKNQRLSGISIPDFNKLADGNAELRVIRSIQTLNQLVENGTINSDNISKVSLDRTSGYNQPNPGVSILATQENKTSTEIITEEQKVPYFVDAISNLTNIEIEFSGSTTNINPYSLDVLKSNINININNPGKELTDEQKNQLAGLTAFTGGEYGNGVYGVSKIDKSIAESIIAMKKGYITKEELEKYIVDGGISLKAELTKLGKNPDDIESLNKYGEICRCKMKGDGQEKHVDAKIYFLASLYKSLPDIKNKMNAIQNIKNNLGNTYAT